MIEGRDLSALLRGRAGPPRAWPGVFLRSEHRAEGCNQYAVRQGRWKYLESRCQGSLRGAELYDLQTDPGERRDRGGDTPTVVQALAPVLWQWRRSHAVVAAGEGPSPSDLDAFRALGYY